MFSFQIYESWRNVQYEKYAFLLEKFPNFFSGKILDIGCGKNFLKQYLQGKTEANIIGTDTSGGDVIADANHLPFPDESFSRIVCIDALHLFDCDFRVLKKNGLAIVSIFFNDKNFEEKRRTLLQKLSDLTIINEFIFAGKEKELFFLAKK